MCFELWGVIELVINCFDCMEEYVVFDCREVHVVFDCREVYPITLFCCSFHMNIFIYDYCSLKQSKVIRNGLMEWIASSVSRNHVISYNIAWNLALKFYGSLTFEMIMGSLEWGKIKHITIFWLKRMLLSVALHYPWI